MPRTPIAAKSDLRTQFFDALFADREGWVCIATTNPKAPRSTFSQEFFKWPRDVLKVEQHILKVEKSLNVYFCVNLLDKPERRKHNCLPCDFLWADLDNADPTILSPPPQIVIRSSPGRWQALWLLSLPLEPPQAESVSKRIAYAYGADKSGWDLTQLLRVPYTRNFKYEDNPEIGVKIFGTETRCPPLLFESLPQLPEAEDVDELTADTPMPEVKDLPSEDHIIYKYGARLNASDFISTYTMELAPDADWSRYLWKLIHICFDVGMEPEEAFSVCISSKVNKYTRDGRPLSHLWRDIIKAAHQRTQLSVLSPNYRPLRMPMLVDPDTPIYDDLVIDRYRDWAIESTDAVPEFHDLCSMILCSTIVANSVRLETSYDRAMVPNIWGMILGDSTLSRKTTAMRMVTDLIAQFDPELVLATDGTAEGLLTGLETRPNKTSIFFKDELSGFFESINHREYLAGMPETLTALYDVPPIYTRRLRKETIRIEHPVFIFFGGGVRDKVYEALSEQYVLSGFLPRFLVVSGETDLSRLRRTGPPTEIGKQGRLDIVDELADLFEYYTMDTPTKIGGEVVLMPPKIFAHLGNDAWETYGDIETLLVSTANDSNVSNLALPTFERLSRSLLKMSLVIAAVRQVPKDNVIQVGVKDVHTAASYIQQWGRHSIEIIMNAGKHQAERKIERIVQHIKDNPGALRSLIMQHYHLSKREADDILGTIEERGLVRKEKQGRGYAYFAG